MEKIKLDAAEENITPKWEKSPFQIALEIANEFYPVTSLFHADLRRQIATVIEAEREVTKHYMTQVGRWWEKLACDEKSFCTPLPEVDTD